MKLFGSYIYMCKFVAMKKFIALIGYPSRAVEELNRVQYKWIPAEERIIYKHVASVNDVRGTVFESAYVFEDIDRFYPRLRDDLKMIMHIIKANSR